MNDVMIAIIGGSVTALIVSAFGFYIVKIRGILKKQSAEQEAIRKGMKALLRDRIVQMYNQYMPMGRMPIYARENVQSLHDEYRALGGNGVIDGLVKKLMRLPTDTPANLDYESRDAGQ